MITIFLMKYNCFQFFFQQGPIFEENCFDWVNLKNTMKIEYLFIAWEQTKSA